MAFKTCGFINRPDGAENPGVVFTRAVAYLALHAGKAGVVVLLMNPPSLP